MKEQYILQDYDAMYRLFKEGKMSEENWQLYCKSVLETLMVEHRDVLIRLKF